MKKMILFFVLCASVLAFFPPAASAAFELPRINIPTINLIEPTSAFPTVPPVEKIPMPTIPSRLDIKVPSLPPVGSIQDSVPGIGQSGNTVPIPTLAVPKVTMPNIGDALSGMASNILTSIGATVKNAAENLINSLLGSLISKFVNPLLMTLQKTLGVIAPLLVGAMLVVGGIFVIIILKNVLGLMWKIMKKIGGRR